MHLATCNARTTLLSRHGSFLMSFCRNRGREGVRPAAGKHRPLRVMILLPLCSCCVHFRQQILRWLLVWSGYSRRFCEHIASFFSSVYFCIRESEADCCILLFMIVSAVDTL